MNELKFIESILDYLDIEGKILFDVGAHFGSFSKPFAEKNWKIHAFEPDPANRVKLEAWAHKFPGLMINSNAVADKPARGAKFFKSDESTGISSLSAFTEGHFEGPLVDIVTLEDYCLVHSIEDIDLLKIDTEGHDLFVLKGFPWEKIRPKVVMTEFENKKTIPLGYRYEDMAQYLLAQGYSVFVSEWKPIVRYGIQHDWNRCFMYPGALETEDAWGNFIALRNDFNRNIFWYGMADQLCLQGQAPLLGEKKNQFRNEEQEKRDNLNLSREEMIVVLNDKMAEVERILGTLEKEHLVVKQKEPEPEGGGLGQSAAYKDKVDNKNFKGRQCDAPHLDYIKNLKKEMVDGCKVYCEIGVLWGGSMIMMMDMEFPCFYIGIDPFTGYYGSKEDIVGSVSMENHFQDVCENIHNNNPYHHKWKLIKGKSTEVVNEIKAYSIDFLFIDGDHSFDGCNNDFIHYHKFINRDGYIVFDNYNDPCWPEVTRAVDRIIEERTDFKLHNKIGNCCVLKKL